MKSSRHLRRAPTSGAILLIIFNCLIQSIDCENICSSVTTSDPILWLQSNRRCQWIAPTGATDWTTNMNYCVSKGGYLAHVYNSIDQAKIASWKAASSKNNQICSLGLFKDTPALISGIAHLTNTHWYLSSGLMLPFYLVNQYNTFIDNWGNTVAIPFLGIAALSYQPFTIQADESWAFDISSAYAICEQSTSRMQAVYTAYPGFTSPATVWLNQTVQKSRRNCARYCAKLQYCMGYNTIIVSSTSITCQYIAERTVDTGLGLVANVNAVYYELNVV